MKKSIYHYYQQHFTFDQVDEFYKDDAIIDGKNGGLLLGPSHDDGGIYFLFEYQDGFRLYGEVEGYEYIINRDICNRYRDFVSRINNRDRDLSFNFEPFDYHESTLIIDARASKSELYNSKYVILDVRGGFGIINKHSTKIHLLEIDAFNKNL
ncbi:hypothetical protein SAMN05444143_10168 [Flavobacterium succinicans]|uniref:Uncharacterized protein n=1 Tax=Flavobacterium succinicans TaxID=29536 RepID=A0A1I4QVD5_9FLAO|nr:hypothetical protein [Flavobacterium succinicans]SFM43957.1 hypothetical protein SAMN05444143_10168 [Flavobacterium succinicans]